MTALIAKFEENQQRIIQMLFMIAIGLLALYAYFLVASVVDTLMRTEYEKTANAAETSVSSIEARYLKTASLVGRDHAEKLGLVTAPSPRFLTAGVRSDSLTLNR